MERLIKKRIINSIFLMALIVLVLCSVFTYRQSVLIWKSQDWVVHTHTVIHKLNEALLAIIDGESQEQSYLNSGNKDYLIGYEKSLKTADEAFAEVKALTTDNPHEQDRLTSIEPIMQETTTMLRQVIDTYQSLGKDAAIKAILSSKQQGLILQVKTVVHAMDTEELELLKVRNQQLYDESQKSNILAVLTALLSGCFLIACFFLLSRQEQNYIREQDKVNRELERQNKLVQQASRLKSEFLANMSHELRTPLNAVIGFSELMQDGEAGSISPEQNEFLEDILSSARHLLRLINDVLDLSKIEAGKMEFRPEIVNLRTLVSEVTDILHPLIKKKKINFSVTVDDDLSVVYIDPARLKQVIYNYLSNALKFTSELGTVRLHIKPDAGNMIRLEVEDNGIGIKPADISRLFVEFEQLDASATKKYSGTGLGLALTKRIVEAQGGQIGATSIFGKGSIFFATLPLTHQMDNTSLESAPKALMSKGQKTKAITTDMRTILVIEDDANDLEWIANVLSANGYMVETAQTGALAIDYVESRAFDLITLDLMLPDTNGYEVLRRIRLSVNNSNTPVIIITAAQERQQGMGFLVSDYLVKPLEKERFLEALGKIGVKPHNNCKIMIVDDDKKALKLVSYLLQGEGFELFCTDDPKRGLEMVSEIEPDVIVLDLLMPEITGFDFIRRLHQKNLAKDIPIIVWTMKELTNEERSFLENSAQGVVLKTLADSTDQLLKAIKKLIRH